MLSSSKALGAVPAPAETAPPSGAAPLLSRSWLLLSQEDARGLYTGALSAREHGSGGVWGVWCSRHTEPVGSSSPSLFHWPGAQYPTLASPPPGGCEGAIGHNVPRDTDPPSWHLIH